MVSKAFIAGLVITLAVYIIAMAGYFKPEYARSIIMLSLLSAGVTTIALNYIAIICNDAERKKFSIITLMSFIIFVIISISEIPAK